jgi:hypothetical protein
VLLPAIAGRSGQSRRSQSSHTRHGQRIARLLRSSTTFNLKSFKCVPLEREIDAT